MDDVLYPLDKLPFTTREFHSKFVYIDESLSLFDDDHDDADVGNENPDVPRPLTPVEEALKVPPSSFSALMSILGPRLKAQEGIPGLPISDQQVFISILLNELHSVWSQVRTIALDPFLSSAQNRELQRRFAVEIILIIQDLFSQYIVKSQEMNQRGVFSGPANFTRLRAQLALDAHKSLNVLSIRRKLAMEMKQPEEQRSALSSEYSKLMTSQTAARTSLMPEPHRVTFGSSRGVRRHFGKLTGEKRVQHEVDDLKHRMPDINMNMLNFFIPPDMESQDDDEESVLDSVSESMSIITEKEEEAKVNLQHITRSHSMPQQKFDTLYEEFGVVKEDLPRLKRRPSLQELATEGSEDVDLTQYKKLPGPGTKEYAEMDLQRLVAGSGRNSAEPEDGDDSDVLPPLLQAIAQHKKKEPVEPKTQRSRHSPVPEDEEEGDDDDDDDASDKFTIVSTVDSLQVVNPDITDSRIMDMTANELENQPQPSVVTTRVPDKGVVRISDVRVSNRINKTSVTLKKHSPVYNDILGEVDPVMLKWLDRNLYVGEEIKEVYDEISKTIKKDHLLFDQDSFVEACPVTLDMPGLMPSSTLTARKSERVINAELHHDILPPWGMNDMMLWRNNPKFSGFGKEDILELGPEKVGKPYKSWWSWWRSIMTPDDYLKFLSTTDNDYLSVVFHLYESDGNDSDDEEEGGKASADATRLLMERERENTLRELRSQKESYNAGLWNVNSVLLGGLGKDPEIDEEELEARVTSAKLTGSLAKSPSQLSKSRLSSQASGVLSTARSSTMVSRTPAAERASSAVTKSVDHTVRESQSHRSAKTIVTNSSTASSSAADNAYSVQERLERVWTLLCMPDQRKMDMAIKYSTAPYTGLLDEAIVSWEAATQAILERENLITKLEDFERTASDPNRFFEKGYQGSSAARLMESRVRSWFRKRLQDVENTVRETIDEVNKKYGDTVTFQGRVYSEKMSTDRTEMLFWLQQERRQHIMDRSYDSKHVLSLKPAELQPLNAEKML